MVVHNCTPCCFYARILRLSTVIRATRGYQQMKYASVKYNLNQSSHANTIPQQHQHQSVRQNSQLPSADQHRLVQILPSQVFSQFYTTENHQLEPVANKNTQQISFQHLQKSFHTLGLSFLVQSSKA